MLSVNLEQGVHNDIPFRFETNALNASIVAICVVTWPSRLSLLI